MEIRLELKQFLHFALHQPGHRDTGPLRDHLGDVVFAHLFAQQAFVGTVLLGEPVFLGLQLFLKVGEGAVFEFGCFVQVVIALGLLHLQLHAFNLLLQA